MFAALLAALLQLAPMAQAAGVAGAAQSDARRVVLTLPRLPRANEDVTLQVRLGAVERGARVRVMTEDGMPIGAVSPFAIPAGRQAGTYSLPLPDRYAHARRLVLRIGVEVAGNKTRAPTAEEVKDVRAAIMPLMP